MKKFPSLATVYDNLFYSCNACNSWKRDFWPTDDQLKIKEFIPNPCQNVMFTHLKYVGERVEARTTAGRLAENILMLNDERSVEYRQFVITLIKAILFQIESVRKTIRLIDSRITTAGSTPQLLQEKQDREQDLDRLERSLIKLCP